MANTVVQSAKRLKISRANTVMATALAVSSFLVVFSLVASKALLSQRAYQARVISKKEQARDQLNKNLANVDPLVNAYKIFTSSSQNVLGGDPNGNGDKDGDNAKITLDALPSKYDFPALATSLEKMLTLNGISITSITGIDQEAAQAGQQSNEPKPVEMPFEINVGGKYADIRKQIAIFEHSIRPFYIDSYIFSGSDSKLTLDMKAKTYFQPEKNLTIKTVLVQ